MRSVCKDFKRDLANVNFRTGSNSKVLNDGFSRLIEFHGFQTIPRLRDLLFMPRMFIPPFRGNYISSKLGRGVWTDNFLFWTKISNKIIPAVFKDFFEHSR